MNLLVPVVMFAWIPVVLLLCALLPTRRAVIVSFLLAWMFLPVTSYHLQGLPAYSKMSATCGGVLLAALMFDMKKLMEFRPSWLDLPMLVWCLCPCASSLANGLGLYDGLSAALVQTVAWGFPYFIGRLYLGDLAGLRELAFGVFLGGLVYVPLCLYEIRMSPQLNHILYGFYAHEDFGQNLRFGGWRPMVFMDHGLMVGMWMSMAALIGLWLWMSGAVRSIGRLPMWVAAPVLALTAILCKSTRALALMGAGLGALWALKRFRLRAVMWVLIAILPAYALLRATKAWDGSEIQHAAEMISPERSQSLEFRLYNENVLIDHALQQPLFGWGGWNRSQVIDAQHNFRTVVDGQWINAMGLYGLVGLISFMAALLLQPALLLLRLPPAAWPTPAFATVAALLTVNVLYAIDNVPNAMINPIYTLAAGGLTGLLALRQPAALGSQPLPQLTSNLRTRVLSL